MRNGQNKNLRRKVGKSMSTLVIHDGHQVYEPADMTCLVDKLSAPTEEGLTQNT